MKNKDFFYLQYNKINWKNQEKTKINQRINHDIIQNIILAKSWDECAIFDIGFGVGFFIKMLIAKVQGQPKKLIIEGCEPSTVNFEYFKENWPLESDEPVLLRVYNEPFQQVRTGTKFDFMTAIYVFPHFLSEDLEDVVRKIHSMLETGGKFILVLADDEYLENKLATEKDLSIETKNITYNNKEFKEVLHYTDIPEIGKVIDYNREEDYYIELFENNSFTLSSKEDINDNGFVCTLFVFEAE